MGVLQEPEFYSLERELEDVEGLIGIEDGDILIARIDKILDRLDESKKARIERANLRVLH